MQVDTELTHLEKLGQNEDKAENSRCVDARVMQDQQLIFFCVVFFNPLQVVCISVQGKA